MDQVKLLSKIQSDRQWLGKPIEEKLLREPTLESKESVPEENLLIDNMVKWNEHRRGLIPTAKSKIKPRCIGHLSMRTILCSKNPRQGRDKSYHGERRGKNK